MSETGAAPAEFDAAAADYDRQLNMGLAYSGEPKEYFAVERMRWLRRCLDALGGSYAEALDFGCGTGTSAPLLAEVVGARRVVGTDVSGESLAVARRLHPSPTLRFVAPAEVPAGTFDLAFCNGVFHHIPLDERHGAARQVHDALRPGGVFAFWENNPWNPGTRFIMSRVPFDRDAVTLTPPEARRLLRGAGFTVLRTDFRFVFPRALAALRRLEPALARLPLGGQYQVLCRKP
jgi:SAM-dependent methyltransferase